jgi:ribosomal protein S4E
MPFWRVLYKEAARLASTREEREEASARLFEIDKTEFGEKEAYQRLNARSKAELVGEQH